MTANLLTLNSPLRLNFCSLVNNFRALTLYVPSVLWHCWLGGRKGIRPVKNWVVGAGVVICLEQWADLHIAQLMPLPLTVSCFSKIQIGFTFLVSAHLGSPRQRAIKRVCVCVCVCVCVWVCLSAIISPEQRVRSSPNFCAYYLWPWLGRAAAGGVVIRYVLLALWMTSYLLISCRPAEAQCTRRLGLGYKLCAVIPVAGKRTHGTTFGRLV